MCTALLAAAALLAIAPESPQAAESQCAQPRGETLVRNGVAVVARERASGPGGGAAYACELGTENGVQLDSPPDGSVAFGPPAVALAGHTLGYAVDTLDNDGNGYTLISGD